VVGPSDVITVRRSTARQLANLVLTPIGAQAFLGMAVALGSVALAADFMARVAGGLLFGFFGLLLAAGAIVAVREGIDSRLIEVDPTGVWIRGMGRLPWSAIAEVRLESMRGVGSGDAPVSAGYRRLGFVPRDPSIRPDAATSLGWSLTRGFFAMFRRMVPKTRFGFDNPAPFGVMDLDAGAAFEPLLAAVRRQVEVVDADERRARERAPRWSVPSGPAATPPIREARVREIDAGIGRGPIASAQSPWPRPRASISAPRPGLSDLAFSAIRVGVPLVLVLGAAGSVTALVSGQVGWLYFIIFVTVLAGFLLPGAFALRRGLERYRSARDRPDSLVVGPDGIWLPDMGRLAWDRVGTISTEHAGWVSSAAGPNVERWRLVVKPEGGPASGTRFSVNSDDLDARFDDVLDLIRVYHPVVETD
jgi:hypothetical protein